MWSTWTTSSSEECLFHYWLYSTKQFSLPWLAGFLQRYLHLFCLFQMFYYYNTPIHNQQPRSVEMTLRSDSNTYWEHDPCAVTAPCISKCYPVQNKKGNSAHCAQAGQIDQSSSSTRVHVFATPTLGITSRTTTLGHRRSSIPACK
jgi:hypothetical protein